MESNIFSHSDIMSCVYDGYSTSKAYDWHEIKSGMSWTISVKVCPFCYDLDNEGKYSGIISQYKEDDNKGFFLGTARDGIPLVRIGTGEKHITAINNTFHLSFSTWTRLTAVYSCEDNSIALYADRTLLTKEYAINPMLPCDEKLSIGVNPEGLYLKEGANLSYFCGLIDDISIYKDALSANEFFIDDINKKPEEWLLATPRLYDRHRPEYHLSPPNCWMNEPHAPFYYKGQYHLFYQRNRKGPFFYNLHWGHWVSDDLAHWRDLPIALRPYGTDIDKDGCWSGSAAIGPDQIPRLFYTAGNQSETPNQSIAVATPCDVRDIELKGWRKQNEPILRQPQGICATDDFRDPFVVKGPHGWIMLVGASLREQGGTALAYSSNDLIAWEYQGPLYISDFLRYPETGTMWELPVLLPVEHKYMFMVCACGVPHSKVENYYWIGDMNWDSFKFIPDHSSPILLDIGGGHFTGPSGFITPDGRSVIFSIAQGRRSFHTEQQAGWAHNAGIPMEISLHKNHALKVSPLSELTLLRGERLLHIEDVTIQEANLALSDMKGDMLEIRMEVLLNCQDVFCFRLRQTPDHTEYTDLYYDYPKKQFYIDRNHTTLEPDGYCTGIQGGMVDLASESLNMMIYLDKSMLEVFINEQACLTSRLYPTRQDALGLSIYGRNDIRIKRLSIWQMKPCFGGKKNDSE